MLLSSLCSYGGNRYRWVGGKLSEDSQLAEADGDSAPCCGAMLRDLREMALGDAAAQQRALLAEDDITDF